MIVSTGRAQGSERVETSPTPALVVLEGGGRQAEALAWLARQQRWGARLAQLEGRENPRYESDARR